MNWFAVAWAGFVATTLSAALFWVVRSVGWTRFSPTEQLGCLFLRNPRSPTTETIGFVLLFLLGSTVVPAAYVGIMRLLGEPGWWEGAVLGAVHGLAAAALLPAFGMITACGRAGLVPPPQRFGLGWGRATPFALVVGHALYGAVAGAIVAGF